MDWEFLVFMVTVLLTLLVCVVCAALRDHAGVAVMAGLLVFLAWTGRNLFMSS
jgi:hypothetical protein